MSQDKIILHYLVASRASRIVWLLEELEVDYEIKAYNRTKEYLAPPELKQIWPLGLSPVVQVFKAGSSRPITLAESGLIVSYMIEHYDTKGKFKPENEEDKVLVDYYLHFAEGTLQPHIVSLLVGYFASQRAPLGFGWLVKIIMGQINSQFYLKKIKASLEFLDNQLKEKNGGFFVGNKLSGADFILDFPINENLFSDPQRFKDVGADFDAAVAYPRLAEWNKLITSRPLHVKAYAAETEAKAKL